MHYISHECHKYKILQYPNFSYGTRHYNPTYIRNFMNTYNDFNTRNRSRLYLVYTCFLSLDEECQNLDDEALWQNTMCTEPQVNLQKVVEVAVLLVLLQKMRAPTDDPPTVNFFSQIAILPQTTLDSLPSYLLQLPPRLSVNQLHSVVTSTRTTQALSSRVLLASFVVPDLVQET